MKPLVLYHAPCWDGFCAAWIAKRALGDIEPIPVQYNGYVPSVLARDVFILDFSFPRETLIKMSGTAKSIVLLDHHASVEKDLAGLSFCKFEKDKSGARMTWEYFHSDQKAPWLVDYTEDRDLWRHALPYSKVINAALRSYPLDFETWESLSVRDPHHLIVEGTAIRRMEEQIIKTHVNNARIIELEGHKVLAVNATMYSSEIAGELAKGRPFGACWFQRQDGKTQWSLRSDDNGVDVSVIAKRRGGGGHVRASGFEA